MSIQTVWAPVGSAWLIAAANHSIGSLAPYRIGVVSGYRNTPAFDQSVAHGVLQVEESNSDQLNLLKLLYGRLDLVVIDQAVMQYWLETSEELSGSAKQLAFSPDCSAS